MGGIGGDLVKIGGEVFTTGMFFWAGSRALALVSYALLSAGVVTGAVQSAKLARGRRIYFVHRALALWGLGTALGHALLLVGDREFRFGLAALLLPGRSPYRPAAVSLGVVALYLVGIAALPFVLPARWFPRPFRLNTHRLAYAAWVLASSHALAAGSDVEGLLFRVIFLASVGLSGFGLFYRVVAADGGRAGAGGRRAGRGARAELAHGALERPGGGAS